MKEIHDKENGGFTVPQHEASWFIGLGILFMLLSFLGGYFWGQKRAISRFLNKVEEESFADRITYSLYTLTGKSIEEDQNNDASEDSEEETTSDTDEKAAEEQQQVITDTDTPEVIYFANIVGFGTLHAANNFVHKVNKMGIPVMVKERSSHTQRGKKIVWYQVVTQDYSDKSELQKALADLQQKEHIKDIKIVEKRKGNEA